MGSNPIIAKIYLKSYKASAAGIRFKKRVYWGGAFKVKRLSRVLNPRRRIGVDGQQLLKTLGRGAQSRCWVIDWFRIYEVVLLKVALQYSKQQRSGLVLVQLLNGSYAYYNGGEAKQWGKMSSLSDLKAGVFISNLEVEPGSGVQVARSAGTACKLFTARLYGYWSVRFPSGKFRLVQMDCRATVGANFNKNHKWENLSKAGTARRLGRRLHVRGVAMNAVDHPHGGKSGPSRTSVSPWGWVTK